LKYNTPVISCYDDELSAYLHKQELEFIVDNMDEEEEQWSRYAEALLGVGLEDDDDDDDIVDSAMV
jgi:hypothetical protein